jgi:hypothetical protein
MDRLTILFAILFALAIGAETVAALLENSGPLLRIYD